MQIILMVSISNNSSGISFVCLQHKLSVYVNIGLIHRLHLHQSAFPILCCSSASLSSEESSSLPDELKLLSPGERTGSKSYGFSFVISGNDSSPQLQLLLSKMNYQCQTY